MSGGRSWTQAEDDLLRRLYASGGTTATIPWGDVSLETDRTVTALRGRAKRLGLVATGRTASRPWSPEEDRRLASLYDAGGTTATIPWDDIAAELGRSIVAMHLRVSRLRLVRTNRSPLLRWTREEEAYLRKMLESNPPPAPFPWGEVCRRLGRTHEGVLVRCQRLGLKLGQDRYREDSAQTCQVCGRSFRRKISQPTCSHQCAVKYRVANGWTHPRGMAGKRHSHETKVRLQETSARNWEALSVEERDASIQRLHAGGKRRMSLGRAANLMYSFGKRGRRDDLGGLYLRSSWEANYARWLEYSVRTSAVTAWFYEPVTFDLGNDGFYTPDFLVMFPDRDEWHEVKGWMTEKGQAKLDGFYRHHPSEAERLRLIDRAAYREFAKMARPLLPGWEGTST